MGVWRPGVLLGQDRPGPSTPAGAAGPSAAAGSARMWTVSHDAGQRPNGALPDLPGTPDTIRGVRDVVERDVERER